MANRKIHINQTRDFSDAVFEVVVDEEQSKTTHTVSLGKRYYKELTDGKINPEDLIKKSFEFLLEREPKESILREFDLPVIQKYFPEFEKEIKIKF